MLIGNIRAHILFFIIGKRFLVSRLRAVERRNVDVDTGESQYDSGLGLAAYTSIIYAKALRFVSRRRIAVGDLLHKSLRDSQ